MLKMREKTTQLRKGLFLISLLNIKIHLLLPYLYIIKQGIVYFL